MTWLFALILLWPRPDLSQSVYDRSFEIGPLSTEQVYGNDSFCEVSIRPLYSGEVEGLPLYLIFYDELTDLVGFEFRKLYFTEKPYKIPGCGCKGPRNYGYMGYSIIISEEEKFLFEIWKDTRQQTIYY